MKVETMGFHHFNPTWMHGAWSIFKTGLLSKIILTFAETLKYFTFFLEKK